MMKSMRFSAMTDDFQERIRLWIQHLKWVKKHPFREEPAEYYQKLIDTWEAKLQDLKND